ncbi:hypothetical protein CDL15_Pgr013403 [Punica granatum]|uniref:cinnamyl-alcohol dehydrogenase n=1 Tax=Punica granatum TaxID=22663 RepID=A0A218W0K6_PUNGR|nr:hypothetical protein CDL15_Pgr013403 [Punica granatum]
MEAAKGTMDGIIDTVSAVHSLLPLIALLKSQGKLVLVGAPEKPLELPAFPLLTGRKVVGGSAIGGLKETQEMINFASQHGITSDIEVISMDYVNTAMERLAKADCRHEIVGVVTEVGPEVTRFKVGDKVGVGCLVGSCHSCESCVNDLENYCPEWILTYNSKYTDGTITYGGYSDIMVADQHFVVAIPDNLPLDGAAPLLCAGITVYSPLRHYGLDKPGLHAAKGTMDGIIDTVSAVHSLLPLIALLKSQGKLVLVGAPEKPLELPAFPLLTGRKVVGGSAIRGLKETQEMINFVSQHGVTSDIEVISMDYVNTAMERLAKADVRYRFVIDIGNSLKSTA